MSCPLFVFPISWIVWFKTPVPIKCDLKGTVTCVTFYKLNEPLMKSKKKLSSDSLHFYQYLQNDQPSLTSHN